MKYLQRSLALIGVMVAMVLPLQAQEAMTTEDVVAKLKPPKLTRSLGGKDGGITKAQKGELDGMLSRSIGIVERKKIAAIAEEAKLPKLDFQIHFGFDSAEILSDSFPALESLGKALGGGELGNSSFLINGHSDSKGEEAYNQELSEQRARAVVDYLASHYSIPAAHLKAIGYGESQLKNIDDPESGDNRRVEIVNLTY